MYVYLTFVMKIIIILQCQQRGKVVESKNSIHICVHTSTLLFPPISSYQACRTEHYEFIV